MIGRQRSISLASFCFKASGIGREFGKEGLEQVKKDYDPDDAFNGPQTIAAGAS